MPSNRSKALRYRRAIFHPSPSGRAPLKTLEEYVREAHAKITTSGRRVASFDAGFTVQMRYSRQRRDIGTLLHLAAFTEREQASIVPRITGTADDAPISTAPPPRGAEYMDGDLLLLVSGNDVIVCANNLHERKFQQYCTVIFNQADLDPMSALFELAPVANANKMQIIESEGVKSVILNSTMFAASTNHISRTARQAGRGSMRKSLGAGMLEIFQTLFGADETLEELRTKENLSAQLVIRFDSRKKDGMLGQERIDNLAKRLLEERSDGFKIRTRSNSTFGHDDLSLQKMVVLPADGKTVQRDATFAALVAYLLELRDAGHLDG